LEGAQDAIAQGTAAVIEDAHQHRGGGIERNARVTQNRLGATHHNAGILPTRRTDDARLARTLNFHGDRLIRVARSRAGTDATHESHVIAVQGTEGIDHHSNFEACRVASAGQTSETNAALTEP
jgi:hypothetical protein